MMEYIYDSQDIYAYYDDLFENKSLMPFTIRKPDLPFSNFLGNHFYPVLNLFSENSIEREAFLKIRWYNFEEFRYDFSSKK